MRIARIRRSRRVSASRRRSSAHVPTGIEALETRELLATAAFVGLDSITKGSWKGVYGVEGATIAADVNVLPPWAPATVSGAATTTWAASTTDSRALTDWGFTTNRGAAAWTSASSVNIGLDLDDGKAHRVSLYVVDWDRRKRAEKIDVIDPANGAILATQTIEASTGGVYATFNVQGDVQFRVSRKSGPNAVVSGLFVDPTTPVKLPPLNPNGTGSPDVPTGPFPHFIDRQEAFIADRLALQANGPINLLFTGDSITDRWRTTGASVFAQNFASYNTYNIGIGGNRTQNLLWQYLNGDIDGIAPKVAVMLIGTNNLTYSSVSNDAIVAGIRSDVNVLKAKLPNTKILLLGILPRGAAASDPLRARIRAINAAISGLDDGGRTVKYMDIGDRFLDAAGNIPAELMPDELHPSAAGYTIIADAIRPAIDTLMRGQVALPGGWTARSVGDPAIVGSASVDTNGVFTVNGAGVGLRQGYDEFEMVDRVIDGDATLVARVLNQTGTDPWAKSGVILRASTAPDSPYVAVTQTVDVGTTFEWRSSTGQAGQWVEGPFFGGGVTLKLTRSGDLFTGSASADGTHYTPLGSVAVALPPALLAGLATTSHDVDSLNTATFDRVTMSAGATAPSPLAGSAWSAAGIGAPAVAGSATLDEGIFAVSGAGAGILGAADQFQFVSRTISGDATLDARVIAMQNTHPWAKAGLMLRGSSAADAPMVGLSQTPGVGVIFEWRNAAGQVLHSLAGPYLGPAWLRLVRRGNLFVGYASDDGVNYSMIGSATVDLPADAIGGLAVTSHDTAVANTATFDKVSVGP